jgi:hypothetical protein
MAGGAEFPRATRHFVAPQTAARSFAATDFRKLGFYRSTRNVDEIA